jgi:hypothetical protein
MHFVALQHNLELSHEVILDHKPGIKTVTLVFNPGSCSESLSLPSNQYRKERYVFGLVQGQHHDCLGVVQGQDHEAHLTVLLF